MITGEIKSRIDIYRDAESRRRFNESTFHGYDFDSTMLRIGSMNMLLHGVENPDIRYRDSLAQSDEDDAGKYTLLLARWRNREAETERKRTEKSFLVPKSEIEANGYDLSLNRYKEVTYEAVEYDPPKLILERLAALEAEIAEGRRELEGLLG